MLYCACANLFIAAADFDFPYFLPVVVDKDAVRALIRAGELVSVIVAGRELVVADSMRAFLKREAKRRNQERRDAVVGSEMPKKAVTA